MSDDLGWLPDEVRQALPAVGDRIRQDLDALGQSPTEGAAPMTLVEFLNARLDEDEQAAKATKQHGVDYWRQRDDWAELSAPAVVHAQRHGPARVLAEVQAKRRIIELHTGPHECSV